MAFTVLGYRKLQKLFIVNLNPTAFFHANQIKSWNSGKDHNDITILNKHPLGQNKRTAKASFSRLSPDDPFVSELLGNWPVASVRIKVHVNCHNTYFYFIYHLHYTIP